jgi:hypothetical protein
MKDTVDGINEQAWERAMQKPIRTTHFIPDYAQTRLVRALCGRLTFANEHSQDPTCPTCRRINDEEQALADALLAREKEPRS